MLNQLFDRTPNILPPARTSSYLICYQWFQFSSSLCPFSCSFPFTIEIQALQAILSGFYSCTIPPPSSTICIIGPCCLFWLGFPGLWPGNEANQTAYCGGLLWCWFNIAPVNNLIFPIWLLWRWLRNIMIYITLFQLLLRTLLRWLIPNSWLIYSYNS